MNLKDIKNAVKSGKTVYWINRLHKVVCIEGQWIIKAFDGTKHLLAWADGTLNGEEKEFFTN